MDVKTSLMIIYKIDRRIWGTFASMRLAMMYLLLLRESQVEIKVSALTEPNPVFLIAPMMLYLDRVRLARSSLIPLRNEYTELNNPVKDLLSVRRPTDGTDRTYVMANAIHCPKLAAW